MKKISLSRDDLDKVRDVEGFPLGTDEDIINISSYKRLYRRAWNYI